MVFSHMTTSGPRRKALVALLASLPIAIEDVAQRHTAFKPMDPDNPPKWLADPAKVTSRLRGLRSVSAAGFIVRLLCTRASMGDDPKHTNVAIAMLEKHRKAHGDKCVENDAVPLTNTTRAKALLALQDVYIAEIMQLLAVEIATTHSATDPRMVLDEGFFWWDVIKAIEQCGMTEDQSKWLRYAVSISGPRLLALREAFSPPGWSNSKHIGSLPEIMAGQIPNGTILKP